MLIELENTTKIYNQGKPNEVTALYDVSLQIEDQTMVCLQGASGSGKSTLLALLAGLDLPTRGHVELNGVNLSDLDEDGRALVRAEHVGQVRVDPVGEGLLGALEDRSRLPERVVEVERNCTYALH